MLNSRLALRTVSSAMNTRQTECDSFGASRGSMGVGESDGGLPPDELVEDADDVLADTEGLFALHEPDAGAWTQIVVAPCSPFSVSIRGEGSSVRILVRDGSRALPNLRHDPVTTPSGRGVWLVDMIASRWGSDRTADGKVVWSELSERPARARSVSAA